MKAGDLLELASRNLREAVLRNTLTTLGIAVGVASLVAMLSLGVGLQAFASRRLERTGLFDSIYVRPRQMAARPGPGSGPGFRRRSEAEPEVNAGSPDIRPLDEAARKEIAALPGVIEVYSEVHFTAEASLGERGQLTTVAGLPPSSTSNDAFDDMEGRFFSSPDAPEVILREEVAQSLADSANIQPAALIGKTLTLRFPQRQSRASAVATPPQTKLAPGSQTTSVSGASPTPTAPSATSDLGMGFSIVPIEKPFTIVGIVVTGDPGVGPGGLGGSGAYIPLKLAETLAPVQGSDLREVMDDASASSSAGGVRYANLTLRTDGPGSVASVEAAIKLMGFSTFSLLDVTRNLRLLFAILDMLLGIFGSLALAVASLGIVNTLVMAILERRREIGVLKALGASNRDVRRLFFLEAGVMGVAGGVVGVGMGWAIGRLIHIGTTIYLKRQGVPAEDIWSVPWWLALGAIAFAVIVSLAAGIVPASRAAKLDPVEALRYE
ncbi:MAG: FtsX-like permease family protein [Candidatus Acidiferrales bacterium]